MAGIRVSDTMDDEFGAQIDRAINEDAEKKLAQLRAIECLKGRGYYPDTFHNCWRHPRGHTVSLRTAITYEEAGVLNTYLASQFD